MKRFATARGAGLLSVAIMGTFYVAEAFSLEVDSGAPAILRAMQPSAYQWVQVETLAQIRGSALDPLVSQTEADPAPPLAGPDPIPPADPMPAQSGAEPTPGADPAPAPVGTEPTPPADPTPEQAGVAPSPMVEMAPETPPTTSTEPAPVPAAVQLAPAPSFMPAPPAVALDLNISLPFAFGAFGF
ncbi:MAG: hypothetical protein ACFCVA_15640 [Gammaproteobacteria bacterium]